MRKTFITLAALLTMTGFFVNQASAAPHGAHVAAHHATAHAAVHHAPVHVAHAAYHLTHGIHFAHGYYFHGRNDNHWAFHRWDARYGCDLYWDPGLACWYYWCQPDDCYYPVSYCPYNTYVWTTPVVMQPLAVPIAPATGVPAITAPIFASPGQ